MTIEEAKSRLLNTAWLGTDEDRDKTEEAVGVLFDAVKAIEDIKAEITSCERDVEYMDSYSDGYNRGLFESLQIIDKHIGEVSE